MVTQTHLDHKEVARIAPAGTLGCRQPRSKPYSTHPTIYRSGCPTIISILCRAISITSPTSHFQTGSCTRRNPNPPQTHTKRNHQPIEDLINIYGCPIQVDSTIRCHRRHPYRITKCEHMSDERRLLRVEDNSPLRHNIRWRKIRRNGACLASESNCGLSHGS